MNRTNWPDASRMICRGLLTLVSAWCGLILVLQMGKPSEEYGTIAIVFMIGLAGLACSARPIAGPPDGGRRDG